MARGYSPLAAKKALATDRALLRDGSPVFCFDVLVRTEECAVSGGKGSTVSYFCSLIRWQQGDLRQTFGCESWNDNRGHKSYAAIALGGEKVCFVCYGSF